MNWDKEQIAQIKASFAILELAQRLGIEIIRGRGRCWHPERHAHGDRTPSVSFSVEKNSYRCFVCPDNRGDVISLVQSKLGLSFPQAIEWLRQEKGVDLMSKSEFTLPYQHLQPAKHLVKKPVKEIEHVMEPVLTAAQKLHILDFFYSLLKPVSGLAMSYIKKRKVFKPTLDKVGIRYLDSYHTVSETMSHRYALADLQAAGLFNQGGHLRFFKHPLIFPYFNHQHKMAFFQARAIEENIHPRFMNLAGEVPFPFHLKVLDGQPGIVYLCESVTDVLTLIEKGFPAVGIAGVSSFKKSWLPWFKNKKVFITFDGDAAGREGAQKVNELLKEAGIYTSIMELPDGMDVNEWFSS